MKWDKVKLGHVCRIEKGNIGITKAMPGEYPLIVLGEQRKSHNEYQFDDEAVIIPLVSSTGHGDRSMKRIHFQSGKFSVGSILCAVIPNDKTNLSAEFLYRYLDFKKEDEFVSRMKGMANVSLSVKSIADVEVPIPPIEVQKTIISKISKLDSSNQDLLTGFCYQLELINNLRQQILQDAVQGKLVKQNPDDEPASILLERIPAEKEQLIKEKKIKKDKPLLPIKPEEIPFEIPENWIWCRLNEIGVINPRNYISDELEVSFIPMNLISGNYGIIPKFEIKKWREIKIGFTHFANNDVAVAKITPCFENSKACIFQNLKNGFGAGTTELYIFRGNPNFLSPEYIYINLKSQRFLINGERIMRGVAGQQRVPLDYFKNFLIPLPPSHEQQRIATKVKLLMNQCDELEQSIRVNQQYTLDILKVSLKETFV
jgi:type I restriction enzyme S subunit